MIDWQVYMEFLAQERYLQGVMLSAFCALLLSAFFSYLLRKTSIYTALVAIVCGVVRLFWLNGGIDEKIRWTGAALLCSVGGVIYLFLFLILTMRAQIARRKTRRAEVERRIAYTLPDRENHFVRTRLNTTLRTPENALNADMGMLFDGKVPLQFHYVRRLFAQLKAAPLASVERLQVEEMGKVLALYCFKDVWTISDVRGVNDFCATLLKLSAKYDI